jgi:hypothetical protein
VSIRQPVTTSCGKSFISGLAKRVLPPVSWPSQCQG